MSDGVGAGAGADGRGSAPQPLPRAHPPHRALPAPQRVQSRSDQQLQQASRQRALVPYVAQRHQQPRSQHIDANVIVTQYPEDLAAIRRTTAEQQNQIRRVSIPRSYDDMLNPRVNDLSQTAYASTRSVQQPTYHLTQSDISLRPENGSYPQRREFLLGPEGSGIRTPAAEVNTQSRYEICDPPNPTRREFILGPYGATQHQRDRDTHHQFQRETDYKPTEVVSARRELVPYHDRRIAPYQPYLQAVSLRLAEDSRSPMNPNYTPKAPVPAVRHNLNHFQNPPPAQRHDQTHALFLDERERVHPHQQAFPEAARATPQEAATIVNTVPSQQQQIQQQQLQVG